MLLVLDLQMVSAEVLGLNATPDYSYSWSNGQTTALATGLGAGQYTCTVTDDNGCEVDQIVTIGHPGLLSASVIQDSVTCFNFSDGGAILTPFGGTPNYEYQWNNNQQSKDLINVEAGVYFVLLLILLAANLVQLQ